MKLVNDDNIENLKETNVSDKEAEEAFVKILKWIGEDPSREGLKSTPTRLIKAFREYTKQGMYRINQHGRCAVGQTSATRYPELPEFENQKWEKIVAA